MYSDHVEDPECIRECQSSDDGDSLNKLKGFSPHVIEARKIFDTVIDTV